MHVIIYGFDSNIANHNMKEICFSFLILAVMLAITGRFIEKHSINSQYIKLIRYKKTWNWWQKYGSIDDELIPKRFSDSGVRRGICEKKADWKGLRFPGKCRSNH